jgi:hypothetical protein
MPFAIVGLYVCYKVAPKIAAWWVVNAPAAFGG